MLWLKTRLNDQATAKAAQAQAEPYRPAFDKYDNGPADPQEILELVNQERQRIGVAPLSMDENVRRSAQLKADDMIMRGYRQHEIPGIGSNLTADMEQWMVKSCSSGSENLSWSLDGSDLISSRATVNGWMNSEPHRKAIQNPVYTKTGIGVNKAVVVQHFCISK